MAPTYSPLSAHSPPSSDISGRIWPDVESLSEIDEDFFADDISSNAELLQGLEETPAVEPAEVTTETPSCYADKLVGDNLDKNVKPSLQRHESKSQSLHYFHSYAVKDRVPAASLPDELPVPCTPDPEKLLHSPTFS